MPNKTGGKNYKKRGGGSDATTSIFVEREDDQHYGRITKNLGNMNMLVYCNDGYERICHIRGAMRKRVWLNPGDIVLVSYRDFEVGKAVKKGSERGDIVHKYDAHDYNRLKRDPIINMSLFAAVEAADAAKRAAAEEKEGFEFERADDDDSETDSDDTSKDGSKDSKGDKSSSNDGKEDDEDESSEDEHFAGKKSKLPADKRHMNKRYEDIHVDDDFDIDNI